MQWHPPPPDYFRVFKDEATSLQPPPLPDSASSNGISELARRVFIRGEQPPPLPAELLSSAAKSAAADPSDPDPRRLLENKTAPEVADELKLTNKRVAASLGKVRPAAVPPPVCCSADADADADAALHRPLAPPITP